MERARARVNVEGVVQGVFFRSETRNVAEGLGLGGWVRNTADGRVEAVFEGGREDVERAVRWMYQGPPRAAVENLTVEWEEPLGIDGFEVRR